MLYLSTLERSNEIYFDKSLVIEIIHYHFYNNSSFTMACMADAPHTLSLIIKHKKTAVISQRNHVYLLIW